ncbi:MAG: DLW-39 family protein [Propionicimonas sp.]|nr:DLW-39 family protein [Propionicimonas sp.]MEA4943956.1 DLW-39 family protein [Propionicimonas sp.]MEA5052725.1 DLW-39 family protein [Propionicimonas sp.]MEA5119344.1 DLW-39 family protein [Propionicimonas sp.]
MKKFLTVVTAVAGAGYVLWRCWQASNASTAQAWAAGTDQVD